MDDCIDRSSAINLGVSNRREWWLVSAAAMVPGCVPAIDAVPADAAADPP